MTSQENFDNDSHRLAVGGMWDMIGKWQLDYLKEQGLWSHHMFLDIGCGSLRGGVHLIPYLENGHYFGIDKNQELLHAGENIELKRYGLENKKVTLMQTDTFQFSSLNQKFDFAWAQSVFTHLPVNNILRCIMNVQNVLVSGGKFYANFLENTKGKFNLEPITYYTPNEGTAYSYFDSDPFHYDFETFQWICKDTDLKVEYLGDCNHPRGAYSKMLLFTKI